MTCNKKEISNKNNDEQPLGWDVNVTLLLLVVVEMRQDSANKPIKGTKRETEWRYIKAWRSSVLYKTGLLIFGDA